MKRLSLVLVTLSVLLSTTEAHAGWYPLAPLLYAGEDFPDTDWPLSKWIQVLATGSAAQRQAALTDIQNKVHRNYLADAQPEKARDRILMSEEAYQQVVEEAIFVNSFPTGGEDMKTAMVILVTPFISGCGPAGMVAAIGETMAGYGNPAPVYYYRPVFQLPLPPTSYSCSQMRPFVNHDAF